MALTTMYEGKNNSPQTDITSAITAVDTVVPVTDISVFPAAPNLATIGNDENAEVIRYNGIDGNTLTGCERGFGGTTAQPWAAATVISRQITKYDLDTLRENEIDLDRRKAEANDVYTKSEMDTALAEKANSSHNHDTRYYTKSEMDTALAEKAPLATEILRFTNKSVSAAATKQVICTISDSKITDDHVVLDCTFANPANITSDIDWNTSNGSVTLSGICSANTTVAITLGLAGNI